jgi:hypothetical protein
MKLQATTLALSAAALSCLAAIPAAHAATFSTPIDQNNDGVFSDVDYNLYAKNTATTQRTFTSKYVAESKMGNNNATNGDWEIGLFKSTYSADGTTYTNGTATGAGGTLDQGNQAWADDAWVDFKLELKSGVMTYTVNNTTAANNTASKKIVQSSIVGPITDLMLRTRTGNRIVTATSANQSTTASKVSLQDLKLTDTQGTYLSGTNLVSSVNSTVSGASDHDYLQISGIKGDFVLEGKIQMDWNGRGTGTPTGSQMALQIKAGTTPQVTPQLPEPGVMGALVVGGIGMAGFSKRKKSEAMA